MPDPIKLPIEDAILAICKGGARVHQLRFAREKIEKVLREMRAEDLRSQHYEDWIPDLESALAQVKAAQ